VTKTFAGMGVETFPPGKMLLRLSIIIESNIGCQFWRKYTLRPGKWQTEQYENLFPVCWL